MPDDFDNETNCRHEHAKLRQKEKRAFQMTNRVSKETDAVCAFKMRSNNPTIGPVRLQVLVLVFTARERLRTAFILKADGGLVDRAAISAK